MTDEPFPADETRVRQGIAALRDALSAGRDLHITYRSADEGTPVVPGGHGVLWPPLGRLPKRVRGREPLLEQLRTLLGAPDGRVHVLAGLGGTGKSTVALQLADIAVQARRPVWWASAVDAAALSDSLLVLAQALGADDAQVDAARTGRLAACDVLWQALERHRDWLLVIDDADDVAELETAGRTVRDGNGWVRGSRSGLVVVSTRDGDPRHWGRGAELHPVGWLSKEQGGQVLVDLVPWAGDITEAEALAERLGGLALALHHAGSQLASPFAQRQSFSGYQQVLESKGTAVLGGTAGDVDDRAVVGRTWELSLAQLDAAGVGQARGLLRVLAWFAPAVPIPISGLDHEILGRACDSPDPAGVVAGLEALLSVGLIQTSLPAAEGATAEAIAGVMVHPLVAETVREDLDHVETDRAVSAATELLIHATADLQVDKPAHWPAWQKWWAHLEEMLNAAGPLVREPVLANLVCTACVTATMLLWAGSYNASVKISEAALKRLTRLGPDHPVTRPLRRVQAGAYQFVNRLAEADRIYRELLSTASDGNSMESLEIRADLAVVVAEQKRFAEAENLLQELLRDQESALGADDERTLATRYEIARTLAGRGDFAEAENRFRDVLRDQEAWLKPQHPATLATRYEIARVLVKQGDRAEAERLFRQLLKQQQQVLGSDHPHTRLTLRALSGLNEGNIP
ncbi:tetratricopeptide repeat protein [Nonomuraea ferruginea]|uniref:Tetratricopeptide repeat protein n=1 Tax=Nonomuraea ferruginea TaxID=46174 RepID=A0ABT4SQ39_9ACTN|nr:tetratricopeptide repeat protein [Nonomuraea ferruginea]MDA0639361.1 tetratricopeptide repeat protein [Nonomuraea ferruginea]